MDRGDTAAELELLIGDISNLQEWERNQLDTKVRMTIM